VKIQGLPVMDAMEPLEVTITANDIRLDKE
jgi:hypothetical protein